MPLGGVSEANYQHWPDDVPPDRRPEVEVSSLFELTFSGPGLTLVTGPNGSGKSTAARALEARVAGARLLSAESQQAFYEAQLAADESNFNQGVDTSSSVRQLLGEPGRSHPLFAAFRLEALWERGYRLLSTGEARKVLLLQAVLRAPSLLILDDPFDGLDRAACAELARAIVHVAERLPVLVVGTFGARELPFAPEALREVVVIVRAPGGLSRHARGLCGAQPRGDAPPKAAAGGAGKLVRAARPRRAARAAPWWSRPLRRGGRLRGARFHASPRGSTP